MITITVRAIFLAGDVQVPASSLLYSLDEGLFYFFVSGALIAQSAITTDIRDGRGMVLLSAVVWLQRQFRAVTVRFHGGFCPKEYLIFLMS